MVSSLGPSAYDTMQTFRTQRSYAAASGLANASAMSSQLFGVDSSTNAALAIFGIDTASSDNLFAMTSEALEASSTISMARVSWETELPTKADEVTAKAMGSMFDFFA